MEALVCTASGIVRGFVFITLSTYAVKESNPLALYRDQLCQLSFFLSTDLFIQSTESSVHNLLGFVILDGCYVL